MSPDHAERHSPDKVCDGCEPPLAARIPDPPDRSGMEYADKHDERL